MPKAFASEAKTAKDLQKYTIEHFEARFGAKTARWLHNICRGKSNKHLMAFKCVLRFLQVIYTYVAGTVSEKVGVFFFLKYQA